MSAEPPASDDSTPPPASQELTPPAPKLIIPATIVAVVLCALFLIFANSGDDEGEGGADDNVPANVADDGEGDIDLIGQGGDGPGETEQEDTLEDDGLPLEDDVDSLDEDGDD